MSDLSWYQRHLVEKHGYMETDAIKIPLDKRRETHTWDHDNADWNHDHPQFVTMLMHATVKGQ